MRKLLFVGVLVLAMSGLALAQDFPKYEVFGGYSYLRSDLNNSSPFVSEYYAENGNLGTGNLNGFEASFTYNLNKWLGIKADFGGHFGKSNMAYGYDRHYIQDNDDYGDNYYDYTYTYREKGTADVKHYTYMFGPEFSYRGHSKVRPFAHALFGFSNVDVQKINVDFTQLDFYNQNYNESSYGYYYEGNVSGSFSNTAFAMALGGGLDLNVNKKIAIRLAQIDYIPTFRELKGTIRKIEERYDVSTPTDYTQGEWQYRYDNTETVKMPADRFNNLRFSAGVVFKF
jgi:hypothetical protein